MKPTKIDKSHNRFKNFFKSQLFYDCFFTILIFAIMLIIISNPKRYTEGTISGIKLFFYSVLPGLFPFMFLTKLLTELGFIFKITKKLDKMSYSVFGTPGVSIYALLMSVLSGYPIGAKIIGDLFDKRLISSAEAKKMSIFCTTSGPIFVIGTVGTIMFNSFTFGIILYCSHTLSSILLGIIFNFATKKKLKYKSKTITNYVADKNFLTNNQKSNLITETLLETINSLFVVGAYITTFFLIAEIFDSLNIFNLLSNIINPILNKLNLSTDYTQGMLYGILEVTRGAKTLSSFSGNTAKILVSGILSFSGLSIIMQSMAFLKKAKIKMHEFIFAKFIHMLLTMFICFLFLLFVNC